MTDRLILPTMPNARRRPVRPPRLRGPVGLPRGPRLYRILKGYGLVHGPGEPPPGFITFTNSLSEWFIYWALAKVIKFPRDPRKGPYIGWPGLWSYQTPVDGGRAFRGGQVVDFIVEPPVTGGETLAIRIQTERYHLFTDSAKHAVDELLKVRLARFGRVVDLFEQDFIHDASGQAAILEVKRALFGGHPSNPLRAGNARRIRL